MKKIHSITACALLMGAPVGQAFAADTDNAGQEGAATGESSVYADASASASSSPEHQHSNTLRIEKTSPEVAEILKRSRPRESHSIPVPKFVVRSANNNFIMTIGGQINTILGYDIGNNLYSQPGAGVSFVTSAIPVPAVSGKKHDFYINPLGNSAVDMQIVGLANTDNEITGYLKIGTNGVNTNVVLQRAYVTWRRFTAGLKLTLMQDDYACQPPTIDPEGPSGCVSAAAYAISYTSKSYNGFRFAAALEMPTYNSSNGYYRGKDYPEFDGKQVDSPYGDAEQLIPDIPAWVEYSFSQWNRVRLTGLFRSFSYRDLVAGKTRRLAGYGVMLSGNLSPAKELIFYYQAAYGKGIAAYIQDIAGHPLSFTPKSSQPGRMEANPMAGFNFGVSYNPTSKLQFNVMGSEARIWNCSAYANALDESENYKYALYFAANCFYNITPYLQVGLEYLWGHRQTWNAGGAHDSRIQTQLAFTF